jgi:hypothetical protein
MTNIDKKTAKTYSKNGVVGISRAQGILIEPTGSLLDAV